MLNPCATCASSKDARAEILALLERLAARQGFLQDQRAEATRRLGEIERERARLLRYLSALDRGSQGEAC